MWVALLGTAALIAIAAQFIALPAQAKIQSSLPSQSPQVVAWLALFVSSLAALYVGRHLFKKRG